MIFPDVDYKEWAKRLKLKLDPIECPKCKKKFTPCIPFMMKGYRGLQCKLHKCGKFYQASIFKPYGKEEVKHWNNMLGLPNTDA